MRVRDLDSAYNVSVSEAEIRDFNSRWPLSEMRGLKGVTFQFDKRNGDLIDIWYANGNSERWDGGAIVALSHDAQEYGRKRLKIANPAGNPGMTKAEKVDEITSWVMNDEGIYNAHLRAKTSVMRQREVAEMAAEMAGIRDQAAIGRAAKELVQTFKESNPYVGDAVQSASARKKQQREKERQQKYGYPAPPRRNAEGHSRGDATLAAGLGSLGGSLIGGIGGAIVGVPMLGAEVGSVAGAIAGGHYYAPPRSMRRTMTGAGIGGLFGPIGAAIGGYVGAGKPDGGGKKSNPHRKSRNPALDENPARVRRMMNPKNY